MTTNKKSWATKNLFVILFVTGLLIGFLATQFLPVPFTGKLYEFIIFSFILFLWGLGGLVVIIRRELPQLIPIKGKMAIVYGIFIMVFCWGLALISLIIVIAKILTGS